MAKEYAKRFYRSKEWQSVREYVLMRESYLCKDCMKPAEEVHHIEHITPSNIDDVTITLNPENLVALCYECHKKRHVMDRADGHRKNWIGRVEDMASYEIDAEGNILPR